MSDVDERTVLYNLPNVMKHGSWQLLLFAFLNWALFIQIIAVFIIHKVFGLKFKWKSTRTLVLLISLFNVGMRAVLTIFPFPWTMFWLVLCGVLVPMLLQNTTFYLLVLYVVKQMYTVEGKDRVVVYVLYPFFSVLLGVIWVSSIIVCYFMTHRFRLPSYISQVNLYSTFAFGILNSLLGLVAFITYRVLVGYTLPAQKSKAIRYFIIIITVFYLVSLGRTIWNITNFFGRNLVHDYYFRLLNSSDPNAFTIAIVFKFLTELLPTGVTIYFLGLLKEPKVSFYEQILGESSDNDNRSFQM